MAILSDFFSEYGMKVNSAKTKFFVVNGEAGNGQPVHLLPVPRLYIYM